MATEGAVQKGAKPAAAPAAVVESESKLHLEPHQILLRPLVTEKGMHRSTRYNAYAFEVNKLANKYDVRRAVEALFDVRVVRVHIQNRKGKPRRSKFRTGMTADWKKAIVKLDPEHRIQFF
ncbi:MAG: 50S ribosomal protein L23 [Planctomycetes bacterium]|nr:50S ribosomal protein L23 [Planctomycetota bacterium]